MQALPQQMMQVNPQVTLYSTGKSVGNCCILLKKIMDCNAFKIKNINYRR